MLVGGPLGTVLVQSSSASTAVIVGLVATGNISVDDAVPMIMGANIGTTVTNTLVSIGHVRRSAEFRRAFSAATGVMSSSSVGPLPIISTARRPVASAARRHSRSGRAT